MPATDLGQRLAAVLNLAIVESGWLPVWGAESSGPPFRLQVTDGEKALALVVYIWPLSCAPLCGAVPDRRWVAQARELEFHRGPCALTVALGWWDRAGVFSAFDCRRQDGVRRETEVMSVSEETLAAAYRNGFAVERTTRGEVTLAFLPHLLIHYFQHAGCLHSFAQSVRDTKILRAIGSDRYSPDDQALASVARGRRGALRSLQQVLRTRSFRARVLTAYGRKCAVCGLASRLPDALHLVPPVPGHGTDDTSNGIALCPTHHKAYDAALITVTDDYRVLVSEARLESLRASDLLGGLDEFRRSLRPYIFIPPEPGLRPLPENLRRGREIRGWVG